MTKHGTRLWLAVIAVQALALATLAWARPSSAEVPAISTEPATAVAGTPEVESAASPYRTTTDDGPNRTATTMDPSSRAAVGCILSGRVRDADGALVASASITVARPDTRIVARARQADARGYALLGLPPGRYLVSARGQDVRPGRAELTVGPDDVRRTCDFTLDPATLVRIHLANPNGTALQPTRAALELGAPADERVPLVVSVTASPPGPRLPSAVGHASFDDVSWRPVWNQDHVAEVRLWTDEPRYAVLAVGDVVLASAPLPGAGGELVLVVDPARVSGAMGALEVGVRDTDGAPLAGATVRWRGGERQADTRGVARLSTIPAGDQEVVVRAAGHADWLARVTVAPGDATRVEARLERPRVGRFRIVDPTGEPVDPVTAVAAPVDVATGPARDWCFERRAVSTAGIVDVPLPTIAADRGARSSRWRIWFRSPADAVAHVDVDVDADAPGDAVVEVRLRPGKRLVVGPAIAGWHALVVRGTDGLPIAWTTNGDVAVPAGTWTVERHDLVGGVVSRTITTTPGDGWQVVDLR